MNILLVEPSFPYPIKSKNKAGAIHQNFVPVGLLKIGAYYKGQGANVSLIRGNGDRSEVDFTPTHIFVTSIFTYWSGYVWDAVSHYRKLFPAAEITVGGIYATLHYKKKAFKQRLKEYKATCHTGLHKEAEEVIPDYSLLPDAVDHHVTHAMRGCIRRCSFCGTWKIEPKRYDKPVEQLVNEIKTVGKRKVVFFDNNFFAHGEIKELLGEIAKIRIKGVPLIYESQSGFDGRILQKKPYLANLLKKANFQNVRIAWDNSVRGYRSIKKQIDILISAGYRPQDIAIFMIYNYESSYEELLKKLTKCREWGVQINDCRYRPLNVVYDNYNPSKHRKGQTSKDYYIHKKGGWTDSKIRSFRRQIRQHNIWVRYAKARGEKYDKKMERWSDIHNTYKFYGLGRPPEYDRIQKSPTLTRRVLMMKRLKNYLKKKGMMPMSLKGVRKGLIDQLLLETCQILSVNLK